MKSNNQPTAKQQPANSQPTHTRMSKNEKNDKNLKGVDSFEENKNSQIDKWLNEIYQEGEI